MAIALTNCKIIVDYSHDPTTKLRVHSSASRRASKYSASPDPDSLAKPPWPRPASLTSPIFLSRIPISPALRGGIPAVCSKRIGTASSSTRRKRCRRSSPYLKTSVDADPRPGKYVVTGSQQFGLLAGVYRVPGGRAAFLTLLPFSTEELKAAGRLPTDPFEAMVKGFYPPLYDREVGPLRLVYKLHRVLCRARCAIDTQRERLGTIPDLREDVRRSRGPAPQSECPRPRLRFVAQHGPILAFGARNERHSLSSQALSPELRETLGEEP